MAVFVLFLGASFGSISRVPERSDLHPQFVEPSSIRVLVELEEHVAQGEDIVHVLGACFPGPRDMVGGLREVLVALSVQGENQRSEGQIVCKDMVHVLNFSSALLCLSHVMARYVAMRVNLRC